MTQANIELLNALKSAGADEGLAEAAARSVAASGEVATKADLAALETRLVRWVTVLVLGAVLGANALLFAALRLTA